jgi:hypothetical protein
VKADRIVIVGGPRTGKSTLARELRRQGLPTLCGDPRSKVKEPEADVEYLPEGLPYAGDGGSADYIATYWLTRPGPWVCEGHVMARALARWHRHACPDDTGAELWPYQPPPCDRIIVLRNQHEHAVTLPGQVAQHKGVLTSWAKIAHQFEPITEYR